MKNLYPLLLLVGLTGFFPFATASNPPRDAKGRIAFIEMVEEINNRERDAGLAEVLAEIPSPFKFDFSVPRPKGPRFSDNQILRRVGLSLRERISGTIGRGGQFLLQTTSGTAVAEGARFKVTVAQLDNQQIEIEVGPITSEGFILKYKETTAFFPIFEQP
ncbi:MAG: hypothetical protein ACFCU4_03070 [Puniceicoccaceae bacterium]